MTTNDRLLFALAERVEDMAAKFAEMRDGLAMVQTALAALIERQIAQSERGERRPGGHKDGKP